jgi:hypothetical protein
MLAAAVLIAALLAPAHAEPVQQPDVGAHYAETWAWCQGRFPYRDDLQRACQWGAYEMVPGPDVKEA